MPQVERTIEKRLTTGRFGPLIIRDGVAGTPVRVRVDNTRFINPQTDVVGAQVTVGVDKIQGLSYGTRVGIDAGGKKVGISGPAGATYSRSRIQVSAADVELAVAPGGMGYLTSFPYPTAADLVVRVDGDALATSPPKTLVATPTVAKTLSGTIRDVANIYESGQGLSLVPGTVYFSLALVTSGAVVYRDLNGDGFLYGPHGYGEIDYLTGEYSFRFAENVSAGTAFKVNFEATDSSAATRFAANVIVQYTAYDNVDGL